MMTRDTLMDELRGKSVRVVGTTEDFDGSKNGIWVSLEEGLLSEYQPGYDSDIDKYLTNAGWFLEIYDGGTGMIYPIVDLEGAE
jgi:hypothetical protein